MTGAKWESLTETKSSKPKDPIKQEILAEEEMLAQEARRLRLEELVEKRKKRVNQIRGTPPLGGVRGQGLQVTPQIAKELAEMPDAKRQRVVESYQMLKGAENAALKGGDQMLWPMILGANRATPDATSNQLVELVKIMISTQNKNQTTVSDVAKIFEVAMAANKQTQPQNQTGYLKDVFGIIKPFVDGMTSKDQELFAEKIKNMQSQIVNPVEYLKEMKSSMGELGLASQADPNLTLQIEQMRGDREFRMEELRATREQQQRNWEREQRKWEVERVDRKEASAKQMDLVEKVLSGPVGKVMENLGSGVGRRIGNPPAPSTPPQSRLPPVAPQMQIQCGKCSSTFNSPSNAKIHVCSSCGAQIPHEMLAPIKEGAEGSPTPPS